VILDATLAFLHFTAILLVAGFLVAEAMLLRGDLGSRDLTTLVRWRRAARGAAGFSVLAAETKSARRYVLVELHLLALLPLAAVLMARGIGH